ncbi:hypothetical protein JCM24511_00737 [Saitozyma sp. JCM 24511]|nr:hypothetical protein JCM24511_00737 [Saitozyma sp. JCM 24511]
MSQGWVNNEVSYDDLRFTTDPGEIITVARDLCLNATHNPFYDVGQELSRVRAFKESFQSEGMEKPVFVYSTSTKLPRGYEYSCSLMYLGLSGCSERDQILVNVHVGDLVDGSEVTRTESVSIDNPRSLSACIWDLLDLKKRPRTKAGRPMQDCFLSVIADNFPTVLERMCSLRTGVTSRLDALRSCADDPISVIEGLGDEFLIVPNTHRFLQHLAESGRKVGRPAESRLYKMHADIYPPPDDRTEVPRASNAVLTAFAVRGDYVLSASRPLNVFAGDGNDTVVAFWHVDAAGEHVSELKPRVAAADSTNADESETCLSCNHLPFNSDRSQSETYVLKRDSHPDTFHTMCRKTSLDNSVPFESTIHDLLDKSTFVDEESRQRFKEVASNLAATLDDELIDASGKAGLLHQAFHGLQGCAVQTIEDTEWVNTDAEGTQTAGYFVDPDDSIFTAPVRN